MLKCRELADLVASGELDEVHGWKRLSASFYLLMCRYCKRYERQVRQVNEVARTALGSVEPTADALERLRRRILRPFRED